MWRYIDWLQAETTRLFKHQDSLIAKLLISTLWKCNHNPIGIMALFKLCLAVSVPAPRRGVPLPIALMYSYICHTQGHILKKECGIW